MSVDVGLELDLDLMVWEMEALPCESTSHNPEDYAHDSGAATHYARVHCPSCLVTYIKAYCQQFVAYIGENRILRCECGFKAPAQEVATVLGPVS